MSNNWNQVHERNSVVQTIVTRAADGVPARAAWDGVAGVWDHFDDESHLLRELQQHWFTSLAASVDNAIEMGEGNLTEDVRKAYGATAHRHRGLRRILDEYSHHPAIEPLVRREHALLARAAGVAHSDAVTSLITQTFVPAQRRSGILARLFSTAS